jgi:excisionase family DNA binding protein
VDELDDIPELPWEDPNGLTSYIDQDWWYSNPDALSEAFNVAQWLDFHIERRQAGETIPDKPVQRLTLTVEEAAQTLGISRAFAYECVDRGDIPCIRIGRRILIPKIALEKLLDSASKA